MPQTIRVPSMPPADHFTRVTEQKSSTLPRRREQKPLRTVSERERFIHENQLDQ